MPRLAARIADTLAGRVTRGAVPAEMTRLAAGVTLLALGAVNGLVADTAAREASLVVLASTESITLVASKSSSVTTSLWAVTGDVTDL